MVEDKDKILNIIQKSGHDFHLLVANKLTELGWSVINSPYYNDPDSDKARELDIIAEKKYTAINRYGYEEKNENLVIKLFIECKYIKAPVVFWFKEKDKNRALELAKDNPILEDKPDHYLDNELKKNHYTDTSEVAWQWSQEGGDIFTEAQHQALKAMIFYKEHQNSEYYEIKYPIIIVNSLDQLAGRDNTADGFSKINKNFQLEINYSYKNKEKKNITKYFLIDVVTMPLLDDFIKQLEANDISLLTENLAFDLHQQRRRQRELDNEQEDNLDPYY